MIKLILAVCVLGMIGCTTTGKGTQQTREESLINILLNNGCDVKNFKRNTRRGSIEVICQ